MLLWNLYLQTLTIAALATSSRAREINHFCVFDENAKKRHTVVNMHAVDVAYYRHYQCYLQCLYPFSFSSSSCDKDQNSMHAMGLERRQCQSDWFSDGWTLLFSSKTDHHKNEITVRLLLRKLLWPICKPWNHFYVTNAVSWTCIDKKKIFLFLGI